MQDDIKGKLSGSPFISIYVDANAPKGPRVFETPEFVREWYERISKYICNKIRTVWVDSMGTAAVEATFLPDIVYAECTANLTI